MVEIYLQVKRIMNKINSKKNWFFISFLKWLSKFIRMNIDTKS